MGGGVVLGLGALVGLVCGGLWFFSSLAEKKELRQERLRALQKRSESVRERSEAVTDAYSAYLFDVVRVVSLPALSDLEIHQTQEFIEAYQSMTGVSWDDTGLDDAELSRRELLVSQAEVSWQKALRFAERTRHTYFSLEEQKRLQNAQRLLAIALNTSSTEAERRLAYERAMKSLEGLVEITEPSRVALEQKVSLMISSTPHVEVPQGSLPSPVSRLPQEECSRR